MRLREAMQLNQRVQSYESFKVYPGVGELVLVKHDNEWHRGRCIEYEEEETFEIFFIDYGFKAKKKLTELRQISEEFLYLSPQVIILTNAGCSIMYHKKDLSHLFVLLLIVFELVFMRNFSFTEDGDSFLVIF